MDSFKGKVVLVTGAARGIGRGIAEAFASEGANLCLVTLKSPLDDVARSCHAKGAEVVEERMGDVSNVEFVKELFAKTKETFGRIDILVNNAGITRDGLLVRMKESDFDEVMNVNLKGAFNCLQGAAKIMMRQRWGRIINISSVVGQIGNAGQVNYASSKAALFGMTKSAARELASRGITVNAIAPGFISTEMTETLSEKVRENMLESIPLARFGAIGDVAAGALYLASEGAGYVTGQTLSINGGMVM